MMFVMTGFVDNFRQSSSLTLIAKNYIIINDNDY